MPPSPIAPNAYSGWYGTPSLSHHDHVERGVQFLGHLERDRHAAARQAKHHDVGTAQVPHPPRQVPSCVRAINEQHRATSKAPIALR